MENSEEFAIIPRELREAIARIKGHALMEDDACTKMPAARAFPVSAAVTKAWLKAEKEALENPEPGQRMPDGTIFIGQFSPTNGDGKGLSQTFNFFAAPEDLHENGSPSTLTYNDTVELLARTKNFHGYDGASYKNDTELYEAIRNSSYNGEWVIPPSALLAGIAVDRSGKYVIVQQDNMHGRRKSGSFKDTIRYSGFSHWSSTENPDDPSKVLDSRFCDGWTAWSFKNEDRANCRPVRLVPCNTKQLKPGA